MKSLHLGAITPSAGPLLSHGRQLDSFTGRVDGPNHEEVGGIFLRDEITGMFGASRQ